MVSDLTECHKKIAGFENLLKINKRKLDLEIERNFELRKIISNKGNNMNVDYQKIVNNLTQTLTDREEELGSQKKLNKEFMSRINELEVLLAQNN